MTDEYLLFSAAFGRFEDVSYILFSRFFIVLTYIGFGVAHEALHAKEDEFMIKFLRDRASSAVPILRGITRLSPIGVDVGDDAVTMVQLSNNGKGVSMVAGANENRPPEISSGSVEWQRWTLETMRQVTSNGNFRGKEVVAAIPQSELFIDYIKMAKTEGRKEAKVPVDDAVMSKIKRKLPFEFDEALIKYIPAEEGNGLVMAAERKIINRHLAIYENAGMTVKSIGIWPLAMTKCYARFFGRRQADIDAVVYLLDIEPNCTNVVICRHEGLLFARSISMGTNQLNGEETVSRLVLELTGCRRHFSSMYKRAFIERLVFLSGRAVEKDICVAIAKHLEMPAQMGDCLGAVEFTDLSESGVDRRDCRVNWAIAFGLSLS